MYPNPLNISPVIFSIGPISIYWYSLAYVFGILFAYWYIQKIDKYKVFNKNDFESLFTGMILGIIIGGRLGYILFYDPIFFMKHPLEIFKTWHGGMSFHGGLLGVVIVTIVFCYRYKINILSAFDLLAMSMPIGIFLGRIANFINGELYGKVSNVPWAMVFPMSGNMLPRHPSQLYEALLEGIILYFLLFILSFYTKARSYPGLITSIAIIWYSISRILIEFVREPDQHLGYIFLHLTMGQILSIPMLIIGIVTFVIVIIKHNVHKQ